jgi:hypothetical protein
VGVVHFVGGNRAHQKHGKPKTGIKSQRYEHQKRLLASCANK